MLFRSRGAERGDGIARLIGTGRDEGRDAVGGAGRDGVLPHAAVIGNAPAADAEGNVLLSHRDVVERLATRLPTSLRRGRVRPLGLDRYGVQLRIEREDGDHDVRLPFTKPVDDVTSLSRAIRTLMGCPFLNGLRARKL